MKEILFIVLFWISTIGYCLYIKDKFKIEKEFLLGIVFILISLIIFIFGLLNILYCGSIMLLIIGIILFFVKFSKKNIYEMINVNTIIIIMLILYVTIFFQNFHLLHYDNFTHWGLVVKNMLLYDKFPNFENAIIEFKAYQPGSAVFIYYFSHMMDLKEGMMIVAQNYLLIAFLSSILFFANNKNKVIYIVIDIATIIFVWFANIMPCDLLVDTLLSVVLIFAFVVFYVYKKDLKKLFYLFLFISLFLCIIKNTGYVLAFVICALYFINGIVNKKTKQGLIGSLLIGFSTLALLYIWSQHVKFSFGINGLSSLHALSTQNIFSHLRELGLDFILNFFKMYFFNFFDIKNNISFLILIVINLLILTFFIFFKKEKKLLIKSIITINVIYIYYYIMLGIMYICSMDKNSLFSLPGFQRYLLTITVVIVVLVILLFELISRNINSKKIIISYTFIIIISLFSYIIFYNGKDFKFNRDAKMLYGDSYYSNSYVKKIDLVLGNKYIDISDSDDFYYLYVSDKSVSMGYLLYILKYKLNSSNISVSNNLTNIINNKYTNYVIVLGNNNKIKNKMINNGFCFIKNSIYKKCK